MTPRDAGRYLGQTLRLMVGVPDYDAYLAHQRQRHPEQLPMTRAEFIHNRQQARFNSGVGRCC